MRVIQFNKMPTQMLAHNAETFGRMIARMLQNGGQASYSDLAGAAIGHLADEKKCAEAYQFVDYCLSRAWLTEHQASKPAKLLTCDEIHLLLAPMP